MTERDKIIQELKDVLYCYRIEEENMNMRGEGLYEHVLLGHRLASAVSSIASERRKINLRR